MISSNKITTKIKAVSTALNIRGLFSLVTMEHVNLFILVIQHCCCSLWLVAAGTPPAQAIEANRAWISWMFEDWPLTFYRCKKMWNGGKPFIRRHCWRNTISLPNKQKYIAVCCLCGVRYDITLLDMRRLPLFLAAAICTLSIYSTGSPNKLHQVLEQHSKLARQCSGAILGA